MWLRIVFLVALVGYGTTDPAELKYDTIIVGMGASGCAAASVLCKAGKKVLALEAQNRIGGRVHTVHYGDGIVELGAEWIHGVVHNPIYDLAIENNITILQQGDVFGVYKSDGSTCDYKIYEELLEFALAKVEKPPKDPEPLGQYLTKEIMQYIRTNHSELLVKQDFITEFINLMDPMINSYESSSSWNDVTTHGTFKDFEGSQQASWHKYGYYTLFEILLNSYNNGKGLSNLEIKLNKAVTKISYPSDTKEDTEVTCEDGTTYRARNVIVTVSLGVLKETHNTLFSPPLPKSKVEYLDYVSMGSVGKIILDFDRIWWQPEHSFNVLIWREEERRQVPYEDLWTTKVIGPSMIMGSNSSVELWTTGNESKLVETLPDDVVMRKSMELIRKFMGKNITIPEPRRMLKTTWYSNPYTRGTYTYDNLKTALHPEVRSILAEPITDSIGEPRVLFAGEATNSIHYSTVHGAVETGFREANRLLPKATTKTGIYRN